MDFSQLFKMVEPFLNTVVNKNADNKNNEKSSEFNSEPISNVNNVKANPIEVITKDSNNNPITIPKSNNGDSLKMLRSDIYPSNFGYSESPKNNNSNQSNGGPLSNILGNLTNGNLNIEELISLAQKVLPLLSEFQGGGGAKSSNILGNLFGKKTKAQTGSDEIHIEETEDDEIVVEDLIRVN